MKNLLIYLTFGYFLISSCSKNNVPNNPDEPNITDTPNIPDRMNDSSFWFTDDVIKFEGMYTSFDSIVIGGAYPNHILEFFSLKEEKRLYRVRYYNDSLFFTFNPFAVNTSFSFSVNDSNASGWYIIRDQYFKISNDTIYYESNFNFQDKSDYNWHYIHNVFQGFKIL